MMMLLNTRRLIGLLILFSVMLSGAFPISPSSAQGNEQPPAPGGVTIHVVQRGENLFRIAMSYGTTVEAIAEANGISDTRYITVGQRLLIPNAQVNAVGAVVTHTVSASDSLDTIARIYHTTVAQIVVTNCVTHPGLIFVGQELMLAQGDTGPVPRAVHYVQAGENLPRIAVRYGVSLNALTAANDLTPIVPVFVGQRLWIPGDNPVAVLIDLPHPLTSVEFKPIPAVQGKTLSIRLTTAGPATLTGTFMGYPVQVVTQDANQHFAIFGIHTFAQDGVYPMNLTVTEPNGQQIPVTFRIKVIAGGYGAEAISIDTEKQDLLSKDVTEPEWQRFARVMSSFTSQRYFDGVMGLPSTGAITSTFGTRRTYNGGMLNTFHSGTDFGGGPGSPVVAPAAGVVVMAENLPVRGNVTVIDHGWGVCTAYFHQSEIFVSVGDVVSPGQTIGTVGSTGRSTGPHLHWEMWVGGVQVDPMQWAQQDFP